MGSPFRHEPFGEFVADSMSDRAIYLQLADFILKQITTGNMQAGQRLPSTRVAANALHINRLTIARAYDALQIEGWLTSAVGKGTFVAQHIPTTTAIKLHHKQPGSALLQSGFAVQQKSYPNKVKDFVSPLLHLDDGYPDPRLAPLSEFYRAYRNELSRGGLYNKFGSYGNPAGPSRYRSALSAYLNQSRNLKTSMENILSVRGTLMGINLVCTALIAPGEIVVSGVPGWTRAEHNFLQVGAKHIGISVDEHGLVVDELAAICKRQRVRMVYVTPHHHYPTTVSLRIDRRLQLLELANTYGFIIFEDDYDFDFHYRSRPLLPLASADDRGMVIYGGSFSKSFSPAFRMGYLAAPQNVIEHLAQTRILLDRQGDHVLDNAMASLLDDGTISRYLRRTLPVYTSRRDHFAKLLESELADFLTFSLPAGGMSIWAQFDRRISTVSLAKKAMEKGLYIGDGEAHRYPNFDANAIRLGFASCTDAEQQQSVDILRQVLQKL